MNAKPPANLLPGHLGNSIFCGLLVGALLLAACALQAASPPNPIVELRFGEGDGITSANDGIYGGTATFATVTTNTLPYFTNNIPVGTYAPAGNSYAVAMEVVGGNTGGRAIDLITTNVNSSSVVGTLGNDFSGVTVCAWLNARTLQAGSGGNRIANCFELATGRNGFDFIHNAQGNLCLSINQFPDNLPVSRGAITADANLGVENWVFVAATWDPSLSSDQVKYYFGSAEQLAYFDSSVTHTLPTDFPVLDYTGPLTVGNFVAAISARTSMSNVRQFRGIIDELLVYTNALTIQEIQQAQLNSSVVPPVPVTLLSQPPTNVSVHAGQSPTLKIVAAGSGGLTYQWQTNNVDVPGATNRDFTLKNVTVADNGMVVRAFVDNDATADPGTPTLGTTLTVVPEDFHKVAVSFSEGMGTVTRNMGNLEGHGTFQLNNGYPQFSPNVPVGPFAPNADYNRASLDMGIIYAGQGNRAVDFTNTFGSPITGTMGALDAFTICGWLNSAHTNVGSGGNRIAFALAGATGSQGFDLVHLNDGSLQLGVNQFPNGMPTSSPGKITSDPNASNANWVFFAVTYDSALTTDPVKFYFGKPDALVTFDSAITYTNSRGVIDPSGPLTIGNFSPVVAARTTLGANSRVFRGLMDEIQIWNRVLTLEEIQAAQGAPPLPPTLLITPEGTNVKLSWASQAALQLQSRTNLSAGGWGVVTNAPTVSGNERTLTLPASKESEYFRLSP